MYIILFIVRLINKITHKVQLILHLTLNKYRHELAHMRDAQLGNFSMLYFPFPPKQSPCFCTVSYPANYLLK